MLFIIFTEHYSEEIFKKFKDQNFAVNGQDLLIIYDDLTSELIDTNRTDSFPQLNKSTRLVFINDFELSKELFVLDILFQLTKNKKELFVLYHENGKCHDQKKQLKEILKNHHLYEIHESHLAGSIYFEEISEIANAFDKGCTESYDESLQILWKRFYLKVQDCFKERLEMLKIIDEIDNIKLPSILEGTLIEAEEWKEFTDQIKSLRSLPKDVCRAKHNSLLKQYFN